MAAVTAGVVVMVALLAVAMKIDVIAVVAGGNGAAALRIVVVVVIAVIVMFCTTAVTLASAVVLDVHFGDFPWSSEPSVWQVYVVDSPT